MSGFGQGTMERETVLEEQWSFTASTNSYAHSQLDERECFSEVTLFDRNWLTTQVVDSLEDQQQDWIGLLQNDWKLELYNLSLLGIKNKKGSLKHACLSVADFVSSICKARSQPVVIFHQQHWGYTCCLQIAGLGRVRLVVCFNNFQCFGRYAVFVTNRLDWSPRHILAHWIQHRSTPESLWQDSLFQVSPQR